ncbi:hypothetical protein U9M48_033212 [Paspalum notatum var. saurae]|uniref:Uncharacterized protein n=1 Tax=Paspalum notatum var. saurae TaxID=547442 RepID=A0AAQ3U6W3_PASNO
MTPDGRSRHVTHRRHKQETHAAARSPALPLSPTPATRKNAPGRQPARLPMAHGTPKRRQDAITPTGARAPPAAHAASGGCPNAASPPAQRTSLRHTPVPHSTPWLTSPAVASRSKKMKPLRTIIRSQPSRTPLGDITNSNDVLLDSVPLEDTLPFETPGAITSPNTLIEAQTRSCFNLVFCGERGERTVRSH